MNDPTRKEATTLKVVLAFATVYIVWGSTYFFILKALQSFPPMLMGAVRFCIAGILMLTWCFIKGENFFFQAILSILW